MTLWHVFGRPGKIDVSMKNPPAHTEILPAPQQPPSQAKAQAVGTAPEQVILAEDGATLRFIPAGKIALPQNLVKGAAKARNVNPFYIDEAPVTNHQFVQFLNQNLSTLTIARGVVREDDEIWLLLGEIFGGYNPIIFRKGQFHVSKADYASFPALRVTAAGAAGYARFYNRRLPTFDEWLYAVGKGDKTEVQPGPNDMESNNLQNMERMHGMMMENQNRSDRSVLENLEKRLSPVSAYKLNRYGVRALARGFGEWSLVRKSILAEEPLNPGSYMIMPSGVARQPWEAFEEVGFRCARDIAKTDG
jgi:serine/threonine-protein kinase